MEAYLDNSATTRPSDAVVSAMLRVLTESWHNPSALYQPAMQAEKMMSAARDLCLKAAGAAGDIQACAAVGAQQAAQGGLWQQGAQQMPLRREAAGDAQGQAAAVAQEDVQGVVVSQHLPQQAHALG